MRDFSVAMDAVFCESVTIHLDRPDEQEDLCFALYRPSTGAHRDTAILYELILPEDGDRLLHGNVSLTTRFLRRAADRAAQQGAGLALLHCHPRCARGWQDLSCDDQETESRHASVVFARLGLPLVGLTLALGDGAWSARRWMPDPFLPVQCTHARNVRVAGSRLAVTPHPDAIAVAQDTQLRTVSFWGSDHQAEIASLTIAIIGLGSVGSIVGELLARTGVRHLILIDYDVVKRTNLDRTITAIASDEHRAKVIAAAERYRAVATAADFQVTVMDASVVEEDGFRALLDADVAFSCVDRPWARHVLNRAAYAHLIPVIDGGILVRFQDGTHEMLNADWSVQSAGPSRACLICQSVYDVSGVSLEQTGLLDDEDYIQGLPDDNPLKRRENIIALSASVAGFDVLQLVAMISGLMNLPNPGQQRYAYYPGTVRLERVGACKAECMTSEFALRGDSAPPGLGIDLGKVALRTTLH